MANDSRGLVEDFLRYRLRDSGLDLNLPPGQRQRGVMRRNNTAASAPSWRAERAMTSHREGIRQGLAPPRLQVVLRCAGDELLRRYRGDLESHVSVLMLCDGGAAGRRRGLTAVREELFRDGVNWGRIVAMMELGGALCSEVVKVGGAWQVDDIAGWMEESLDSAPLRGWIEDNGGWDAFVQLYGEAGPAAGSWSWRTVVGLAALGAAGLALGAWFSHR